MFNLLYLKRFKKILFLLRTAARVFVFLSDPLIMDTRRYGEQYESKGRMQIVLYSQSRHPSIKIWYLSYDVAIPVSHFLEVKELTYVLQAAVAVQAGVCVDIFAVTNEYTDLVSLKFLSIEIWGSLFLYTSTEDSTLPQDM